MRRSQRVKKQHVLESSSDEETPEKPEIENPKPVKAKKISLTDDSSSESDIENYLQPADQIDLNSSFFDVKPNQSHKIPVDSRLSDSDDANSQHCQKPPETVSQNAVSSSKLNFQQLHDYTKMMEDAQKHVDIYNAKKKAEQEQMDVSNLLAAGESRDKTALFNELGVDLHSSDFESCSDSEKEGWEEVENVEKRENASGEVPKEGLQITVEMPDVIRKKKKNDIMAAIKRRLNRIKKENQVLVHKVHLLCWIAHGNYVSSAINSQNVLATALSLLPNQQCYPADRTDLKYLEQIVKWYGNSLIISDKVVPKSLPLETLLQNQMEKKEAYNKKMFVFIFVAILRALGIQCRVVFSFQVEPLRPPNSELHSVSTKDQGSANNKTASTTTSKDQAGPSKVPTTPCRSKATQKKITKVDTSKKTVTTVETSKKVEKKPAAKLAALTKNTRSSSQASQCVESAESKGTNIQKTQAKKPVSKTEPQKEASQTASKKAKTVKKSSQPSDKVQPKKSVSSKKDTDKSNTSQLEPKDTAKVERRKSPRTSVNTSENTEKPAAKLAALAQNKSPQSSQNTSKPEAKSQPRKTAPKKATTETSNTLQVAETKRSKSTSDLPSISATETGRKRVHSSGTQSKIKKEVIKIKLPETTKQQKRKAVAQLDGVFDTDSENEEINIAQLDGSNESDGSTKPNLKKLKTAETEAKNQPKRAKKVAKYRDSDSGDDFAEMTSPNRSFQSFSSSHSLSSDGGKTHRNNDVVKLVKKRIKETKIAERVKKRKNAKQPDEDEEDSDFVPEAPKRKHVDSDIKVKQRLQRKVLSSDEDNKGKRQGVDVWAEVFLETEEKWISVDVIKKEVHCVKQLYDRATHPVAYIVAWNNNNTLKDLTRRYCQNYNTLTRKLRIDSIWWERTLKPFKGPKTVRDKEEDEELEREQLEKPLPKTITEYKDHPLYVLKRHLLKFQAIYPPDAPTLGFIRNEPVYSRQCVYTLHSREIWLKSAKVVKLGEKPYKIVKARPKWDKLSNTVITDQLLEIFGIWQTEDYVPPTAENGVVPRNAFGNVELFKECMLPKKTVHLRLPGLNKIARRMDIDCASAVVGFDFHSGWSHPTFDGFIVCEEFEEVLIAAWHLEQEEIERKEQEKLEKRVYDNWKKLIKGLLIRERLKKKYDLGEGSGSSSAAASKKNSKQATFATKKQN